MRTPGTGPDMNLPAARLAGAFHRLCGKLHNHASGAAHHTRKVGEIFSELDRRARPSAELITPARSAPVTIPTSGPAGPVMSTAREY